MSDVELLTPGETLGDIQFYNGFDTVGFIVFFLFLAASLLPLD
jgi:hypothetical protein